MLKIETPGYHKSEVSEPLILEPKDFEDDVKLFKDDIEEWDVVKRLFGFNSRDNVTRIKVNITSVEYFIEETQS